MKEFVKKKDSYDWIHIWTIGIADENLGGHKYFSDDPTLLSKII